VVCSQAIYRGPRIIEDREDYSTGTIRQDYSTRIIRRIIRQGLFDDDYSTERATSIRVFKSWLTSYESAEWSIRQRSGSS
jgi:hypothetical protein